MVLLFLQTMQKRKEILEVRNAQFTQDVESEEEEDFEFGHEEGEEESEGENVSGKKTFFMKKYNNENDENEEVEEVEGQAEEVQGRVGGGQVMSKVRNAVKTKKNQQRVLLITSRGITYRYRHLMQDLNSLLPHSKKDAKLDSKSKLEDINEIAELNNCNNCIYFETRKHQDMYMWMSKAPNGPSAKFSVKNVHTMDELKLTGNCLKGSRPVLSFDAAFDSEPYLQLLKEMFTQTYSVPTTSRKTKPFIDHVMSFSVLDNKIWIRNYHIVEAVEAAEAASEEGPKQKKKKTSHLPPISLVEIGPRFVLELMRIFDGSFAGSTLYENPNFVTANNARRLLKGQAAIKHAKRADGKLKREEKLAQVNQDLKPNPIDAIFD